MLQRLHILRSPAFIALAFSLLIKLFFVLFPLPYMQGPRMGDDALTYQWKAHLLFNQGKFYTSKTFENLATGQQYKKINQWLSDRVTMRAVPIYGPLYSLAAYSAQKMSISLKAQYAILETLLALLYTYAVFVAIRAVASPSTTVLSLLITAFYFDRFSPTYLSLGFALITWANLLNPATTPSLARVIILSTLVTLGHPVGKAYALVSLALYFLRTRSYKTLVGLAALALTITAEKWLDQNPGITASGVGGFSLEWHAFFWNLRNLPKFMYANWAQSSFIVLGLFVLVHRLIIHRRVELTDYLILGLTSLSFASMFHIVPGHRLEVFFRFHLPLAVLVVPYTLSHIFSFSLIKKIPTRFALFLILLPCFYVQLPIYWEKVFTPIKAHAYFLNEERLSQYFLDPRFSGPVVFAESDYALFFSMIYGHYHHDLYSNNLLQNRLDLIPGTSKIIGCSPLTRKLNPSAHFGGRRLMVPKHGLHILPSETLTVHFTKNEPLNIEFRGPTGPNVTATTECGEIFSGAQQVRFVPYGGLCLTGGKINFTSLVPLQMTSLKKPLQDTDWPWLSDISVTQTYDKSQLQIDFNLEKINAEEFRFLPSPYTIKSVLRDDAGLVCFQLTRSDKMGANL